MEAAWGLGRSGFEQDVSKINQWCGESGHELSKFISNLNKGKAQTKGPFHQSSGDYVSNCSEDSWLLNCVVSSNGIPFCDQSCLTEFNLKCLNVDDPILNGVMSAQSFLCEHGGVVELTVGGALASRRWSAACVGGGGLS